MNHLKKIGAGVSVMALSGLTMAAATPVPDEITEGLATMSLWIVAIGGGFLAVAALVAVYKWAKAAFF